MLDNIDLLVCDMAGTVVQEGGLVYKVMAPEGWLHAENLTLMQGSTREHGGRWPGGSNMSQQC